MKLAAIGRSVGIVLLRKDAGAAGIRGFPDDDKAAVGKARNIRVVLIAGGCRIDLKLIGHTTGQPAAVARHRVAVGVKALRKYSVAASIGAAVFPHHDEIAAGAEQLLDRRQIGGAGRGLDHAFAAHRHRPVRGRRDIDLHKDRIGGAPVAIGDLEAQLAHLERVVGQVAIGQVLDQQLDDRRIRVGVERDLEGQAARSALRDGAHLGAVDENIAGGDGDAVGLPQTQHVLGQIVGRIDLVDQRRRGNDIGDKDRPAVEIGGIRIRDRDRAIGVDQARYAVDVILVIEDLGVHPVKDRIAARGEIRRVAENTVEHARAVAIARGTGGL